MAERYLCHDIIERRKAARQYDQYFDSLGLAKLSRKSLARIEAEYKKAVAKFGDSFKEEYGWASVALNNKRPNFAEIEKAVDLNHWRPYYKQASDSVHAGAKGLFFSLGLPTYCAISTLAGASNAGLSIPGRNTALALMVISVELLTKLPFLDYQVACRVMQRLTDEIVREFELAEARLERSEKRRQRIHKQEIVEKSYCKC